MHPGQDLDEGRFAGAVVAEHTGDLPGAHLGGDALEGDDVAVELRDVLEFEQWRIDIVNLLDQRADSALVRM